MLGYGALVLSVGHSLAGGEVEHARLLAEGRADASCELRERVGFAEQLVGVLPVAVVEGVVQFGVFVAERTSPVAERHAAVHTSAGLFFSVVRVQCLFHLTKVVNTVVDGAISSLFARHGQKCFWVSHFSLIYIVI